MQSPPLCRFAKRGCAHSDELFKPAYQRVNRARGTKILRCFPHCCPAHIPRSYCGATIELRVPATPGLHGDDLFVFARFRLREEPAELRVGDRLALAAITRGVQSPANTKLPWIQSRRRPASAAYEDDDHASFAFEINPGRRWYYSWHSSKNSAKRATKHVLEAFVFVRDGDNVRCVASVTSPSFTLVSFRRVSASETALIGEELKDQAQPREPVDTREPLRASLRVLFKDDMSSDKSSPTHYHPHQRPHRIEPEPMSRVDPVSVLFRAAQQFPMGEARQLLSTWIAMAEQDASSSQAGRRVVHDAQLAAHVVGWLMLDATTQAAWRDHTKRGARALLDKHELRACFDRWTRWLASHVECQLATLEQPPLLELAAKLMPVGPTQDQTYCFGWRSFVAQARELFTGVALPTQDAAFRRRTNGGAWSCPLERVRLAAVDDHTNDKKARLNHDLAIRRLPATVLFAFWQQMSHLHIDLHTQCSPHELVLSTPADDASPVMRLLLDNRARRCNALPHGEATMGAAPSLFKGFSGDYVATQRRDGMVEVNLFTWSASHDDPESFRLRWTFARTDLSAERLDVNLMVSVTALQGLTSHSDMATATMREKLAQVESWRDAYKAHLVYTRDQ